MTKRRNRKALHELRSDLAKFDEESQKAEEDRTIKRAVYQLELEIATRLTNAKLSGPAGPLEDAKRDLMAIIDENEILSSCLKMISTSPIPKDIKAQVIERLVKGTYGNINDEWK